MGRGGDGDARMPLVSVPSDAADGPAYLVTGADGVYVHGPDGSEQTIVDLKGPYPMTVRLEKEDDRLPIALSPTRAFSFLGSGIVWPVRLLEVTSPDLRSGGPTCLAREVTVYDEVPLTWGLPAGAVDRLNTLCDRDWWTGPVLDDDAALAIARRFTEEAGIDVRPAISPVADAWSSGGTPASKAWGPYFDQTSLLVQDREDVQAAVLTANTFVIHALPRIDELDPLVQQRLRMALMQAVRDCVTFCAVTAPCPAAHLIELARGGFIPTQGHFVLYRFR